MTGGVKGRTGDRLHRLFHQHLADRGLHSAAADGRYHRAPVPRVRDHALHGHPGLDGDLAHHHADDVLASVAMLQKDVKHGRLYRWSENGLQPGCCADTESSLTWVLDHPALVLIVFVLYAGAECVPADPEGSQGLLPAAGHGRDAGWHARPAGHLVLCHARRCAASRCGSSRDNPGVQNVMAFTGGQGTTNGGFTFIALKPLGNRAERPQGERGGDH
jgi:hypothetical protein